MGAMKDFAFDTIESCIKIGGGRTTAARLSVRFTTLGVDTTPDQAATLAKRLGFKVTRRRVTIDGTDTTQYVVQ
ncbi:MAG: hypothetical protein ACO3SE_09680 [Sedimenticolaceae bacterium]